MLSWVGVNMPCFSFIFFTINYNDRDKTISYYYVASHGGVCSAIAWRCLQCHCMEVSAVPLHGGVCSAIAWRCLQCHCMEVSAVPLHGGVCSAIAWRCLQCHCMEVSAVPLHGGVCSAIELTVICS